MEKTEGKNGETSAEDASTALRTKEDAGKKRRRRIVVKVGTSSLLNEVTGCVALKTVASVVETIVMLKRSGIDAVLVTSGSVGFGRLALNMSPSTKVDISDRRALASIGQARLMSVYSNMFSGQNITCAQVLLTYGNLGIESQFENSKRTFEALFKMGVVPIVNENDPVADRYTKFGDNDCLSAMVSALIGAEKLYLLTDVDGLYTSNPHTDPKAKKIDVVRSMEELIDVSTASSGGPRWGTGGMATKLKAAEIAANCGVCTVIMLASRPERILDEVLRGETVGTKFLQESWGKFAPSSKHKLWIRTLPIRGEIWIDDGAVKAIRRKRSLFAVGVRKVCSAMFKRDEVVRICDLDGATVALGLTNYGRNQLMRIRGKKSSEIAMALDGPQELFHRSNILLMAESKRPAASSSPPTTEESTASKNIESIDVDDAINLIISRK